MTMLIRNAPFRLCCAVVGWGEKTRALPSNIMPPFVPTAFTHTFCRLMPPA